MSTRPPCTAVAAAQKARAAEDGWTSRAPGCVTLAHAGDSRRRIRKAERLFRWPVPVPRPARHSGPTVPGP
jgi:nuclear transport factor 2 (NTF2) superfamily protein